MSFYFCSHTVNQLILHALDKSLHNNLELFKIVCIAGYCPDLPSILLRIENICNIDFMNAFQFLMREKKPGKFFLAQRGDTGRAVLISVLN